MIPYIRYQLLDMIPYIRYQLDMVQVHAAQTSTHTHTSSKASLMTSNKVLVWWDTGPKFAATCVCAHQPTHSSAARRYQLRYQMWNQLR